MTQPDDPSRLAYPAEHMRVLAASITDIQGTIRALDAKMFAFLGLLLLPLTQAKDLGPAIHRFVGHTAWSPLRCGLVILTLSVWGIGILAAFFCIFPQENPTRGIRSPKKGVFFCPGKPPAQALLRRIWSECRLAVGCASSSVEFDVDKIRDEFLVSNLLDELVFEQAKLAVIRQHKFSRQRIAMIAMLLGLTLAALAATIGFPA